MKKHTLGLWLLTALLATAPARAVIIAGGDGTGNTNAPANDPGWANVGRDSSVPSSVVYLGANWFLTAYHIENLDNPTSVLLNGSTYGVDTSSWHRLSASGFNADLAMFRATTTVTGLPTLTLSSSPIATGAAVTMIGDGVDRASSLSYWDSAWNPTDSADGVHSGYYWAASTGTKRWGQNLADGSGMLNDGFGTTHYFSTAFDADGGPNEAQGALYDSGGGVFFQDGANWELAGIMLAVDGHVSDAAAFGDHTYIADLAPYHDQIAAIMAIPEPAGVFLAGLGVLCAARMFRRWRS